MFIIASSYIIIKKEEKNRKYKIVKYGHAWQQFG
jgi:hypothetical protein